jgi:Flp pilus assembly protein TadD
VPPAVVSAAAAAPPAEPAPAAAVAPSAAPPEPALAPRADETAPSPPAANRVAAAQRTAPHKRKLADHAPTSEPSAEPAVARSAPAPAAVAAAVTPPPEEKTAPAVRGPREVLAEGEKQLGQGEVHDACVHGEEAKRMNPRFAPAYKFLGKCYMRAGNASQAKENYQKYLELAPNAPDAMFVKSIIK